MPTPTRRGARSTCCSATWNDVDGDRIVDCDLLNFAAATGECAGFSGGSQDTLRYGRDPLGLDEAGIPIGLATTQCGRTEKGIPPAVQAYCAAYGDTCSTAGASAAPSGSSASASSTRSCRGCRPR